MRLSPLTQQYRSRIRRHVATTNIEVYLRAVGSLVDLAGTDFSPVLAGSQTAHELSSPEQGFAEDAKALAGDARIGLAELEAPHPQA